MERNHATLCTGLYINPQFPHLGASPDGLLYHALAVVKVYLKSSVHTASKINTQETFRFTTPNSISSHQKGLSSCRGSTTTTSKFKDRRQYVSNILQNLYCWTPKGMHVERIFQDSDHFQGVKPKIDSFFINCILPRILRSEESSSCSVSNPAEVEPILYYTC